MLLVFQVLNGIFPHGAVGTGDKDSFLWHIYKDSDGGMSMDEWSQSRIYVYGNKRVRSSDLAFF